MHVCVYAKTYATYDACVQTDRQDCHHYVPCMHICMDTLGFEPRAFRMRSGCDTTTPCAQLTSTWSCGHTTQTAQDRCGKRGGPHVRADGIIGKDASDKVTIHNMDVRITYWGGRMVARLGRGKLHQHSRLALSHDVTWPKHLLYRVHPQQSSIAALAQLAEHALRKRTVVGSIPTGGCLVWGMVSIQTVGLSQNGAAIRPALAP